MKRRHFLVALGVGLTILAGSLLLTVGSRPRVTATMQPTRLATGDSFTLHVELRNPGPFTVEIRDQCQPLQLHALGPRGQTFSPSAPWRGLVCAGPMTYVFRLRPGESRQATFGAIAGGEVGLLSGEPAWPSGRYTLMGTYYGQPLPSLAFEIVEIAAMA